MGATATTLRALGLLILLSNLGVLGARKVAKVERLVVSMGPDGTDDDVRMQVSTETDGGMTVRTCTTPVLNSWFGDDWSPEDREIWEGSDYIGDCFGFEIYDDQVWVTLILDAGGYDGFSVANVAVEASYAEMPAGDPLPPYVVYNCYDAYYGYYYLDRENRSEKDKCNVREF